MDWFAVRHFVKNDDAYEEWITLWSAESADEAVKKAEAEAEEYVWEGTTLPPLFQSFRLSNPPGDGGNVPGVSLDQARRQLATTPRSSAEGRSEWNWTKTFATV